MLQWDGLHRGRKHVDHPAQNSSLRLWLRPAVLLLQPTRRCMDRRAVSRTVPAPASNAVPVQADAAEGQPAPSVRCCGAGPVPPQFEDLRASLLPGEGHTRFGLIMQAVRKTSRVLAGPGGSQAVSRPGGAVFQKPRTYSARWLTAFKPEGMFRGRVPVPLTIHPPRSALQPARRGGNAPLTPHGGLPAVPRPPGCHGLEAWTSGPPRPGGPPLPGAPRFARTQDGRWTGGGSGGSS